MNLSNLTPANGAVKKERRIGRGQGSGHGGTSTRGHKGAKSRSGYKTKIGFEGGQMPLQRRIPKFGFKNINRIEFKAVNLDIIESLAAQGIVEIDFEVLKANGVVSTNDRVKILGRGKLNVKVSISANAFSASAIAAIEAVGGTHNTI
ncbi:MAG: 50S ribosomal protein L15 [Bacteroidetes bacterium]|nr:50S ribosomal protein L15 [Bacteroidota bacterium]